MSRRPQIPDHLPEQRRELLRRLVKAPLDPFVQKPEQTVGIEPGFAALHRIVAVLGLHDLVKGVIYADLQRRRFFAETT